MKATATAPNPRLAVVLSSPRAGLVLLAAFVVYAGYSAWTLRHLHDEGQLTYFGASFLGFAPMATLFFQKLRPVIGALYAPVALFGSFRLFCVAHVLVSAAGLWLLRRCCVDLGMRYPNVPPIIVAASPLIITGASAGFSNVDGLFGCVLALHLLIRSRWLTAGVVLGCLPWVRHELAVFSAVVLVMAALRTQGVRWRLIGGAAMFPVGYWLLGSLYHSDLLWLAHYPPALKRPSDVGVWKPPTLSVASVREALSGLVALSPAFAVPLVVGWRRLRTEERYIALFGLVFAALMIGVPFTGLFNFEHNARYLSPLVLPMAVVVGRGVSSWPEEPLGAVGRIAAWLMLGSAAVLALDYGWRALLPGAALVAGVALLSARRHAWFAAAIVATCIAFGIVGSKDSHVRTLEGVRERLADLQVSATTVVTNDHRLAAYLSARGAHAVVNYLMPRDQLAELSALTNPANGQRPALRRAVVRRFYGIPIFPGDMDLCSAGPGYALVLKEDERLSGVISARELGCARLVHQDENYRIFTVDIARPREVRAPVP